MTPQKTLGSQDSIFGTDIMGIPGRTLFHTKACSPSTMVLTVAPLVAGIDYFAFNRKIP